MLSFKGCVKKKKKKVDDASYTDESASDGLAHREDVEALNTREGVCKTSQKKKNEREQLDKDIKEKLKLTLERIEHEKPDPAKSENTTNVKLKKLKHGVSALDAPNSGVVKIVDVGKKKRPQQSDRVSELFKESADLNFGSSW